MGTSVSQPSPRTTNWSPVHAAYRSKDIPEQRVIKEIWRAFDNEPTPISATLKAEVFYDCYKTIGEAQDMRAAIRQFDALLLEKKHNSIIAEFSKRAIPAAFYTDDRMGSWKASLFVQVTDYIISRDISGFVGEGNRNRTIGDVIKFKDLIAESVSIIVRSDQGMINSKRDWNTFVERIVRRLKENQ